MVLIRCPDPSPRLAVSSHANCISVRPQAPTALETTARLLSGGDVKGNLRERELRRLPRQAVCVGDTNASLQDMREFVSNYPDRLSLVSNSCVTFVDAFITRHKMG